MPKTRKKLTDRQIKQRKLARRRKTRRLPIILERHSVNTSNSNNSWEKVSNNEFNHWVVPFKRPKKRTSRWTK